jgi:hypothetical protein
MANKRGRPPIDSEQLNLRMSRDLLDALDRFIVEARPDMGRPEALRMAFRDWALERGYLTEDAGSIDLETLNAENDG